MLIALDVMAKLRVSTARTGKLAINAGLGREGLRRS